MTASEQPKNLLPIMPSKVPAIVGLIGGVSSGKSTVARFLQERGALWLDSDRMAHEVLNTPDVIGLLRERFGSSVILNDGQADRQQIARLVFGTDSLSVGNLVWLESVIHPRVRKMTEARIADAAGKFSLAIIDAPLLLEAGWGPLCERILFVDTPAELREELAKERGWSADELRRREAAQMPLDEKRAHATDVINNCGSIADLELQVDRFVKSLATPS